MITNIILQLSTVPRWVFNWGLSQRKQMWENEKKRVSLFDQNNELTVLKKGEKLSWLKTIHSQVLQQGLCDLDRSFLNFFNGLKKNIKVGYPKFKCKGIKDSFRYPQGVKVNGNKVWLPKIGWIKFKKTREIEGVIKQTTVIKERDKWDVVFSCEIEKETPKVNIDPKKTVGIDLGLKYFANLAIGEKMNIKAMMQGLKNLSRAISDAAWGMFLNCLKNKVMEYGKNLYEVSSFLGSTLKCSNCGQKNEIKLGQSKYVCECGQNIDRDLNAAINIKNLAVGASV